jgi:hypothetical protein
MQERAAKLTSSTRGFRNYYYRRDHQYFVRYLLVARNLGKNTSIEYISTLFDVFYLRRDESIIRDYRP